ncbi:hypothetical protein A3D14_01490 [Candidatus Saccharibacteria bacterium RIFCSPHIGHO2_02_FULL_47_12]|nr:MAG: hypothetical protein A3D14_01490 [Candidatus Saccharibacteria bacterium RIFCSPHIGHO2_02_FULL_47_12]
MYYVYFIKMNNGQIYTGFTANLKQRITQHKSGMSNTTRKYLPLTLLGYEAYIEKTDAIRREKFLKTTEGKRLLKLQYRDIISTLAPSSKGL